VALSAPKPDETPSGARWNKGEAMKPSHVKLYESRTPVVWSYIRLQDHARAQPLNAFKAQLGLMLVARLLKNS